MAISTKARAGTIPVMTEAALNAAIASINNGGGDTIIDVQGGFTLTANTTAITANMTITSSNGSVVNDGGYAVLTVGNGATVSFSLNAGGTGASVVEGDTSTLVGLTGGVLAYLSLADGAGLTVAAGQRFVTAGVNVNGFSGITLGGVLDNADPIILYQSQMTTTATGAQANDIYVQYEAFLTITSNTAFKARRVIVDSIGQIGASGSEDATLINSAELLVQGQQVWYNPGLVTGVNVGNVTLVSGGRFNGILPAGAGLPGCNAGEVKNHGGHFNTGQSGTWNVASYEQTDGALIFTLPDFAGNAPVMNVAGAARCTGGEIQICAGVYYVEPPVTNKVITLLTAAGGLSLVNTPVRFLYFPTGVSPGLSVTSKGISIKLTIDTPPR